MNQPKAKIRRVLGVDPGFDRLGLAVLEGNPSRPVYIWSACVIPPAGSAEKRLASVFGALCETIKEYAPDAVAVETLFFSTNRKTALRVSEARGAILAAIGRAGVPVIELSPAAIKIAITGRGNSEKSALMRMVPKLVALPPRKRLDDEFDAIAAAIAGLAMLGGS